ncbi:MAG: winged helix-turn-helix domain-containing protein [Bacteroidia bacterium]
MAKKLDPLLHNELRLAIMSLLISLEEADFPLIKEKTGATSGNISVQIQKLKEAGYIQVEKKFKDNYPQTLCKLAPKGIEAFENYVTEIKKFLGGKF